MELKGREVEMKQIQRRTKGVLLKTGWVTRVETPHR